MAVSRSRCSRQIGVGPAAHSSNYISTKLWNQTSSKGIASGDSAALMWDPQLMIAATKPYWVITHTYICTEHKSQNSFRVGESLEPCTGCNQHLLRKSSILSASDESENNLWWRWWWWRSPMCDTTRSPWSPETQQRGNLHKPLEANLSRRIAPLNLKLKSTFKAAG